MKADSSFFSSMWLIYTIDNLHIENRVDLIANPLNEKREGVINSRELKVDEKEVLVTKIIEDVDDLGMDVACNGCLDGVYW